ncbi:protein CDV3 homolog [Strongylocentrotus purpuratus]|uniref:Protein CDV3 homolog n=1 Tax=Strongylocentrotus purpuratus TaxID=7668 RepID=A0A7M7THK0_STRPU|nr:protein CDV3 homolog [Strongylocentrotus purpuratus]
MTESEKSLEDFFAKKSKKKGAKGKGKSKKITTTDEVAKKMVEQDTTPGPSSLGSVSADVTTKKPKAAVSTAPEAVKEVKEENEEEQIDYRFKDDDEWTDFRDDSQKDYSGLKIQALQVTDEPPVGEEEEEEVDENGEIIKTKGQGASGPWNRTAETARAPAPAPTPAPAPAPAPEPVKEEPKPAVTSGGKYVPPNRRGAGAGGESSSSPAAAAARLGMARKGKAPQLNSEFEFPTLAASSDLVKHSNKVEDATFSTVTKGGQAVDGASSKGGNLQLGNRYAALEN